MVIWLWSILLYSIVMGSVTWKKNKMDVFFILSSFRRLLEEPCMEYGWKIAQIVFDRCVSRGTLYHGWKPSGFDKINSPSFAGTCWHLLTVLKTAEGRWSQELSKKTDGPTQYIGEIDLILSFMVRMTLTLFDEKAGRWASTTKTVFWISDTICNFT